jgi:hypothetical protein
MSETGSTTITRESQTAGEGAVLTIAGEPQAGAAGSYPVAQAKRSIETLECRGELNRSAHHRSPMMCRWRLVWVRLGLASNSRI